MKYRFQEYRKIPRGGTPKLKIRGGGWLEGLSQKPQKYLSKNSNIRKMLKSYPLNILKVQPESSKVSSLGQILIFPGNCTPNYLYESF